MSARDVLSRWSQETITHAAAIGVDGYGQRMYATPIARPARVDYETKLVRNTQGQEVVSGVQVYLATTDAIQVIDQITLPDGSTPVPLRVERLADYAGVGWMVTIYC